jgi:hypothetical protein
MTMSGGCQHTLRPLLVQHWQVLHACYALLTALSSSPTHTCPHHHGLQEEHSRVVYVHDVCASSFRAFLHYLYSDTLALDHYSVLDLLYLSRKYLLHHLTKQCTAYVRAHLSCANALQWLVWAREQVGAGGCHGD